MNDLKSNETDEQEEKRATRLEKAQPDYPTIKVQLPKNAAIKVHEAMLKLKERKAEFRVDDLLAGFLDEISDRYLESKIDQHTPDEYYFIAAGQIPELRDLIIQKAKAALNKAPMQKKRGRRPKLQGNSDAPHNP